LAKLAKALDVEVYALFQDKTPPLPANVQNTLAKFKKDIAVSLHKTVSTAIDGTLETIGSHYLEKKPKEKKG
jgi:hypothetical protein